MHHIKLTPLALLTGSLLATTAFAAPTVDKEGNTGYATAAECDAAVIAGTARFYQPVTQMPTKLQKGEKRVSKGKLSDLGPAYQLGACDLGVGRKNGRNGVSKALQGKYVPFSPDSAVNLYADATGKTVRASMAQCDNRFSGAFPRAVPVPPPAPAPVAVAPAPAPAPAPVVAAPAPAPAPVVMPAPAPAPVAKKGITPYVFGTLGAVNDSVNYGAPAGLSNVGDSDRQTGGQLGVGLQFNDLLGAELFYQGGKKHEYAAFNGTGYDIGVKALGARLTLGTNVTEKLRLFGKLGTARVTHDLFTGGDESKTRALLGAGLTYSLSENLGVRFDYDHIRRQGSSTNPRWGNIDYFGLGLQYSF